jgi:hypothetical protein
VWLQLEEWHATPVSRYQPCVAGLDAFCVIVSPPWRIADAAPLLCALVRSSHCITGLVHRLDEASIRFGLCLLHNITAHLPPPSARYSNSAWEQIQILHPCSRHHYHDTASAFPAPWICGFAALGRVRCGAPAQRRLNISDSRIAKRSILDDFPTSSTDTLERDSGSYRGAAKPS